MLLGVRRFSALAALVARIYGGYKLIQLSRGFAAARGEPVGPLGAAAMMACQTRAIAARRGEAAAQLDQLVAAVDAGHERCESGEAPHPEEHPRIVRGGARRRNVALQSHAPTGKLRRRER